MLRSYEPPSVCGTVSGLVPPRFDVSRRLAPLCDNRAITSHSGTMLLGSMSSSREDENSRVNGRFLGSGPLCVGRTQRIVRRSARTLGRGRLIVGTPALAGGRWKLIARSPRLIVGTRALA